MSNSFRTLPSVQRVLAQPQLASWAESSSRSTVVDAVREVLDQLRCEMANDEPAAVSVELAPIVSRVIARLERKTLPPLPAVINGTGIILHTGLGRAPLAARAIEAVNVAASKYVPLELDLDTGDRCRRSRLIESTLCALTGAEAACLVNNNAAALVLTLASIARGREVLVSRGELIEIGGGFRLPDIMAASGARLVEVGTTNRTRAHDFEQAIGPETAAILKVHPSNYQTVGFVETVGLAELTSLAHRHRMPCLYDLGSGLLHDLSPLGLVGEPLVRDAVAAGADLVMFSGDKLLGGPQAGLLVGGGPIVEQLQRHPLMRAFRVDKLNLAALAATLELHREFDKSHGDLPIYRMAAAPLEQLDERGARIAAALTASLQELASVAVVASTAYLGGGSLPQQGIESRALQIAARATSERQLARRLRLGTPAIMPRVQQSAVQLDLRTVLPEEDEALIKAVANAIVSESTT